MPSISRRRFVQGAATVAVFGPACQSVPRRAHRASPAEEIRVAVVGIRSRGVAHIEAFRKLPNVRVAALCDVDEDILGREAAKFESRGESVDTHIDVREIIDRDDIDVVSIATPNHWHALITIWACQAGKDVFVEKPVSHNIWEGGQMVWAARKYDRIVQTGTQGRSMEGIRNALAWVHEGGLGPVRLARGICYKKRASIGRVEGPQPIPRQVHYDLWSGPAPLVPLERRQLHYDWHWRFDTGNGDLGNQGIHQMDVCRWAVGQDQLPKKVVSVGGRFGYEDDGETPNTQIVYFDYEPAPVLFEVRGLPRQKSSQVLEDWGKDMDRFMGLNIGAIIHCEHGTLRVTHGTVAEAYDHDEELVERFEGGGNHVANFIDAVRSGRREDLTADIQEGHLSSALCHMGNISHRLGRPGDYHDAIALLEGRPHAQDAVDRMYQHLVDNRVDVRETPFTLGPILPMNSERERFTDRGVANDYVRRAYRRPFVVPRRV